jgi:hypothetical protein
MPRLLLVQRVRPTYSAVNHRSSRESQVGRIRQMQSSRQSDSRIRRAPRSGLAETQRREAFAAEAGVAITLPVGIARHGRLPKNPLPVAGYRCFG